MLGQVCAHQQVPARRAGVEAGLTRAPQTVPRRAAPFLVRRAEPNTKANGCLAPSAEASLVFNFPLGE